MEKIQVFRNIIFYLIMAMLYISNLSFDTDEETLASIMGKVCFIILKKTLFI